MKAFCRKEIYSYEMIALECSIAQRVNKYVFYKFDRIFGFESRRC